MPHQPRTRVPARLVQIGTAGLASAGLALGAVAAVQSQPGPAAPAGAGRLPAELVAGRPIPAELAPPAGSVPVGRYPARGVQVYTCTAGSWTFQEPAATLTAGPGGPGVAVHFRGPSWQSTTDGSLVQAKAVASVKVEGSIPQLLLEATSTRGPGRFGSVTAIQRLHTSGGAAPTGACTDGTTVGVAYRAEYVFYRAG
jgi:hypothetical protein